MTAPAGEPLEYPALVREYGALLDRYRVAEINPARDRSDVENQVHDAWHDQHYLDVGREAIEILTGQLIANKRPIPQKVLDYASGSGRVTRHLQALFPDAQLTCLDLYQEHLDFCAREFGVDTIRATENPDDVVVSPEYDLVFSGSLLTHLPQKWFWPTMHAIARSLSPTGIALVTLEGRRAEEIQDTAWKLIDDKKFESIRRAYKRRGFGFADYANDMRQFFPSQENYGIALVKPSWVMAGLEQMDDVRVLAYIERAWDDHQDVVVFGRPGAIGVQ